MSMKYEDFEEQKESYLPQALEQSYDFKVEHREEIDYEELRKQQLKNLDRLCDNIESRPAEDYSAL